MPLYEYTCIDCDVNFEIRRGFDGDGIVLHDCGAVGQRVYSFSYSMPGKSNTDSWNDWIDGREAAVGMTRERTQQLAQHAYREGKKADSQPVAPRKSVSTPGNPSPHQRLPD